MTQGAWKLNIKEADVDTILIEEWFAFIETASKKKIRLEMDMEETLSEARTVIRTYFANSVYLDR